MIDADGDYDYGDGGDGDVTSLPSSLTISQRFRLFLYPHLVS